ncbi:hypothetical protein FJ938_13155 [Mesorhizobium sp. B2-4-14]|uniref:hypothetical protein n=1 Tax=Mesorhizobium sp. B2-4-14 TaxID=2589935 RepID=UPI00112BD0E6|nr:hypothetical protein [Mesorhizobium sp. B2-4-14]TPL06421.1 hypothetical protein FJ938_13155 [Mesorhizobium sp. B2-4-14]
MVETREERFDHRGETWRRQLVVPVDRYVMGVDLGQSVDPTAIAVLHHRIEPRDDWEIIHKDRVTRQRASETFDVRHLERVALGVSYPEIVQHTMTLLARPPLRDGCDFVIDETGVGRAVGDMFDAAGLAPIKVQITAGNEVTSLGARRWGVPKALLVSTLDARLHGGELRFAAALAEGAAMAEELKDFQRHVTAAGRATYAARTGRHDDLVLAVAIALWRAVSARHGSSTRTGFVQGMW